MRKYWHVIKQSYIKSLTYRSEVILWLILDTIPLIVLMFVWLSMYRENSTISGYSLPSILQYYFLVTIINGISSIHFETWRVQEIRDGKIDYFLMRPLTYPLELLLRDIGGKLFYLTISLPFFFLLFTALSSTYGFSLPFLSIEKLLAFGGFVLTAYAIEFLIGSLIVMSGFWLEYSEGLEHFKWIIITLFSGWMIPIAMMPPWLKTLVETLPFKYMYAVPIGVIQGTHTLTWIDVGYIALFVLSLVLLRTLVWSRAQYRYSSQGG